AKQIGVKQPTIARFETSDSLPDQAHLQVLLELYGRKDQFTKLRQVRDVAAARKRDQSMPIGTLSDIELLIGLEHFSSKIEVYETMVVTGLLQTRDYARAIIEKFAVQESGVIVEDALDLRLARQAVLDRGDDELPPDLTMYVDESTLRLEIGGKKVLAGQLEHLLKLEKRDNITIRVIPADVVYHAARDKSFTLLTFDDDWKMAYAEDFFSTHYHDSVKAIGRASSLLTGLHGLALPASESRGLISDIREELT
uniref:DUF5753 domain-containing protein n=1 Tax=Sciscionella marina TaxID=508770 RepID=UPI000374D1E8